VSERAVGPCGAVEEKELLQEELVSMAPYLGYLESHGGLGQPFALLGGPIQVSVNQNGGDVLLALPDYRRLDPQVFGTRHFPRAFAGTPIITGVPFQMRETEGKFLGRGEEYTKLGALSPFGDKYLVLPEGTLTVEAMDVTATDAAATQDFVRFEANLKDSAGNTYTIRTSNVLPHGVEYPVFGGVVTNHIVNGSSGIGTPLMPTEFAYLAFWGIGETLKNGEVTDSGILVHGMLTEHVRTADGRLAFDDEVTPTRLHMRVLAPPVVIRDGKFEEKPVQTGFLLPDGEELSFWHVMFDTLELDAQRLPVRSVSLMRDGGMSLQSAAGKPAVVVEMDDRLRYAPSPVTIQSGQTIQWVNRSRLTHTVTADASLAIDKSHVQLPEGARPFNSGNIRPKESFSYTFTVPGAYRYFCIPHEANGMIGEITVQKAGQ